MAKAPQRALGGFAAQLAKGGPAVDDWLDTIPRLARTEGKVTVYRVADPAQKWCNLLVNHWRKLDRAGWSDEDKRKCLRWLIGSLGNRRLQDGIPDDIWSGLMLRVEEWDDLALDRLHKMRQAMEAEGAADEASDMFRWLMQRECGVNPKAEPNKLFSEAELQRMISIDILLRNCPAFRGNPIDVAAVRRVRDSVEQLMRWKNADFELPRSAYPADWEYPVGMPIPSHDYGRALERAQFDRMFDENLIELPEGFSYGPGGGGQLDHIDLRGRRGRTASETVGDSTSGKAYKGNFPHFDLLFKEGGGVRFGQVTHGDPVHLVNKYLRLIGIVDRRLDGAETEALQNLRHMGYLKGGYTEALLDMRRRSYLFVPENQVDGLRVLVAGNPNFEIGIKRLGLTADEALDRIRAIAQF